MNFVGEVELFSRTFDNMFIFNLFDLLLCGVIVLVVVRGWRTPSGVGAGLDRSFLLLAFCCLAASFAVGAVFAGAFFFFHTQLPEDAFGLLIHALWASAWLLLLMSALERPDRKTGARADTRRQRLAGVVLLAALWAVVVPLLLIALVYGSAIRLQGWVVAANVALDVITPILLAGATIGLHRHPLGEHNFARIALVILFLVALLHAATYGGAGPRSSTIIWNLEQFGWSLALFTIALAIGEIGTDLFDRAFVVLQVTFILLASLMILVITQTEKTDYLASIRDRSDNLAEFVRANVDYLGSQDQTLPTIVQREDFLQRAMLSLGNVPELKVLRITAGRDVATFEIGEDGRIVRNVDQVSGGQSSWSADPDKYFLIRSVDLRESGPGTVEFFGTREVLDRHIRKRILIIFSLFTGMVVLSTVMIGLVVRGASATIRQQARTIEDAQQKLMQTSKLAAIGQLAAGVAHEINNPATTILTRSSFLLSDDQLSLSDSEREDLDAIMTQAQRIAHITNDLLLFSRSQMRAPQPVDPGRAIDSGLALVRDALAIRRVIVVKDFEPDAPRVLVNEQSLVRVFENLFRNAIDAMPDGGELSIRLRRADLPETVCIEVRDSGSGIDPDDLPRVFDPFFTTKEVGKGTGLGLSIVHGIVTENHGTITVESEPGEGTTFNVILPAEE